MKIEFKKPPRKYKCGILNQVEISDCGNVFLLADEQITFITDSNKEYDVTAKEWGFYATPSVNGRLMKQGFKTALVKNSFNKYYVMIVNPDKMDKFNKYISEENQVVVEWLDERI